MVNDFFFDIYIVVFDFLISPFNNFSLDIKQEGMDAPTMAIAKPIKERKKHDRFNGMSEEEVCRRTLPDHLAQNLDIIIVSTLSTQIFACKQLIVVFKWSFFF